jgi:CubicO group peptidase (beta-lactamase class C family)
MEPRRQVELAPGPPQPPLSLAEAGVDADAIQLAVEYAGARNTTALVVGLNGHVLYQKYWGASTLDTEAELSGFSPVLAALVLGTAQQNGEIRDLDIPVAGYLPEWASDPRGTITLRDLLTGKSNLAAPGSRAWPRSLAARYYTRGDMTAQLLSWPQAVKPDAAGSPAEVDADVLSLVLSRAFKLDYAGLLKERIWVPLGAGDFSVSAEGEGGPDAYVRAGCRASAYR